MIDDISIDFFWTFASIENILKKIQLKLWICWKSHPIKKNKLPFFIGDLIFKCHIDWNIRRKYFNYYEKWKAH